jgi:hypothetical protein
MPIVRQQAVSSATCAALPPLASFRSQAFQKVSMNSGGGVNPSLALARKSLCTSAGSSICGNLRRVAEIRRPSIRRSDTRQAGRNATAQAEDQLWASRPLLAARQKLRSQSCGGITFQLDQRVKAGQQLLYCQHVQRSFEGSQKRASQ